MRLTALNKAGFSSFVWVALLWMPAGGAAQNAAHTYDPPGNMTSRTAGSAGAPDLIIPPATQLVRSNGQAAFSVVAAGAGLSYQWYSNGVALAGATSDTLLLAGLAGTNSAGYTVRISNASGSVTSGPPATLWADFNANDIPDWWELQHFGNLNQKGGADFDNDGISNLDEYREGTLPASKLSFNPRLTLQNAYGSVLQAPSQPAYTNGQYVSLTAIPDPGWVFLGWSGDSAGTKPQVALLMDTNKFVRARFGLPLPQALDHPANWTTGGDAQWFGQAGISHDTIGAAQSGPVWAGVAGNFTGQQTWIQTVTNSSQNLKVSFWWAVSSQPPDALEFHINGVRAASISGESLQWQFFETNLPPDNYVLHWRYAKGPTDLPSGVPFLDSAFLDQVSIGPESPALPPALSIIPGAGNSVVLAWPAAAAGFLLQQNTNVASASTWLNSDAVVTLVGENFQATAPGTNAARFFRLKAQ